MRVFLLGIWEIIEVAIVAAFTVFLIRSYLIQPFLVSGASMEPNFSSGNYLLVDEITYRFREPSRKDVIVFRYPGDNSIFYIKRIIGLPDERVVIKDGAIKIFNKENPDGLIIEEEYLSPGAKMRGSEDITLKPDQYFVLGDNRYNSFDSRSWGPLSRDKIIGMARMRLFPITKIDIFWNAVNVNN